MQIIIPMSGLGSRFKAAGYETLKPLIKVNGKPIIEYVSEMFPGGTSFLFICREEHIVEYDLLNYLLSICPNAKVVTAKPNKLGPVSAVLDAEQYINDDEPVMVSYCDYYMHWDFKDFEKTVINQQCDGSIVCYSGFHPHLLHEKNVYAGCRVGDTLELLEIKEKFSFEADKTKGQHSVGAYYFKNGALLKHYFKKTMAEGESLNGEFYVSLVYPLLLQNKLDVRIYNKVPHFMQWGTPEDLEEYIYWSDIFLKHNYK